MHSVLQLIVTVITGFSDLRKGRILAWATLLLFGTLLIAVGVLGMTGILPVMGMLIYAALAAVTFGSILAKIPFTLQYARDMVDRALWENPVFIRVNVLMTGVWGGIFAINFTLSYLAFASPRTLSGGLPRRSRTLSSLPGSSSRFWYRDMYRKNILLHQNKAVREKLAHDRSLIGDITSEIGTRWISPDWKYPSFFS